ncbi:hypothetical protein [Pseudomonas aeruginosa]|uniref:hypothetical protein n=3 Tax=Pseudomonas aeruginosa TaxID=287 RepID=UPI0017854840|nr:hypothetical protein [Pseudomonas aeruginosa]MBG5323279.1 hypothetical protein [Pseudomonas aeruginosa]MCW5526799.1 hypothetical protein [Pseudomonas aeruginosa]MCW5537648.1 hypothetical protein [Pseudomonas aeruginosa]
MNKANECTCPSGDGSLVHPCPAHPAVEQAGTNVGHGHVFPRADGVKMRCGGPALCSECAADAYRARAALAQPSPAGEYGDAYQGAREDIAIWKRRALEAEQALRQAHNGQTFMGEPLVQPYEAPREKVNALFKVLGFSGTASVGDILDAALERLQAQPSPALPPFAEKVLAKLRRFYDCASDFESGGVDIGRHWLDLLTQLGLLNRVQRSPALWEISQQGEDLLGMPQPSPAQAEAERPEVAEVAFVLRNIGAMDAEDIDGDNVDLRFEDAEGRDTGCDVSIVEYAEKAADLLEQHDRIVGALRAKIAQLRQHKNDYMDAGQETYRALQNEIREREAEIARLDGLVSGRTAERDAALARVAELKTMSHNYCALLMDANAKLAELEKQEPINLQHMAVAADGELRWMTGRKIDNCELYAMPDFGQAPKLYAAPVAQAQHSVPEGWMLVECGIWTQEQVDEMQKTVTRFRNSEFVDDRALAMAVADAGQCKAPEISLAELLATAPGKEVPQAWIDVQAERRRQITAEGWTPEHDDLYCAAELPRAAAAYILNGANDEAPAIWPFVAKWWKPRDARSNYVRAGALILAEIERLDRAALGKEGV